MSYKEEEPPLDYPSDPLASSDVNPSSRTTGPDLPDPPSSPGEGAGVPPRGRPEGDSPQRHISAESLEAENAWSDLTHWLVERASYLPLLGFDERLIRKVTRMDSNARREYLHEMRSTLLTEQEQAEVAHLHNSLEELVQGIVAFWRAHRGL